LVGDGFPDRKERGRAMQGLLRKYLIIPVILLGLSIVFIILSIMLFISKGNDSILRKKLRIGGLILALQGVAIQGVWPSSGQECYVQAVPEIQVLSVLELVSGETDEVYVKSDREFTTAHPDVELEHTIVSVPDYYQIVSLMIAAEEWPDVVMFHSGPRQWRFSEFQMPLDKYIEDWKAGIPEDVWAWHCKDGDPQNPVQMVPLTRQGAGIYYNKANLRRAGLDPDRDYREWDEFLTACEALKEAGITPILSGSPQAADLILQLLWGSMLGEEVRTLFEPGLANFRDPRIRKGAEYLLELQKRGYIGLDQSAGTLHESGLLFSRGQGGFFIGLLSGALNWKEFSDGFGAANCGYFPNWNLRESVVRDAQVITLGGVGYSILTDCGYPEQAAEYLRMRSLGQGARALFKDGGFPASAKLHIGAVGSAYPVAAELIEAVCDGQTVRSYRYYLPDDPVVWNAVRDEIELWIAADETDIDASVDRIQKKLEGTF
jgi:ABC-type glycerol-3-phosphate transport system substrate-binding protein